MSGERPGRRLGLLGFQLWLGLASGLMGGTLVGLTEGMLILATAAQATEYAALFYALVLYGGLGAVWGLSWGLLLGLLGLLRSSLSAPLSYVLGMFWTILPLGSWVWAQRQLPLSPLDPLPNPSWLPQGFGWLLGLMLFSLWLGPILLTRTPLRIILRPRGTVALGGVSLMLTAIFSFTPTGRGNPHGSLRPDRGAASDGVPPILLISVDGWRWEPSLRLDDSPQLEALREESLVFSQAYTSSTWLGSSIASLLTGAPPLVHGLERRTGHLEDKLQTLPELLQQEGYSTCGLSSSIHISRSFNFHQGFDYFRYLSPPRPLMGSETSSQLSLYGKLRQGWERYGPAPAGAPPVSEELLLELRRFVEAQEDRSHWFAFLQLSLPEVDSPPAHGQDLPGPSMSPEEAYRVALGSLDAQLGELLEWLQTTERYDPLMIVLTSSRGQGLGEHASRGMGSSLYNEELRVPLWIKLPHGDYAGVEAPWALEQADLAPTLAQAAGIPIPAGMSGSLLGESLERGLERLQRPLEEDPEGGPCGEAHPAWRCLGELSRSVLAQLWTPSATHWAWIQQGQKLIILHPRDPELEQEIQIYRLDLDPREQRSGGDEVSSRYLLEQGLRARIMGLEAAALDQANPAALKRTQSHLQALGVME